ncbi:MAG: hypothetical protein LAN62_08575, partial [Acidobacteriia bacterium]|nr:hypothetical protein [Terriglobia bacterium]
MITTKRLLWIGLSLVALVVLWIVVGNFAAGWREAAVARRWAEVSGRRGSLAEAYHASPMNQSAEVLEDLAAKLGIEVGPLDAPNRPKPAEAEQAQLREMHTELNRFVRAQLERPTLQLDPPPAKVSEYLAAHESGLAAMRAQVLGHEPPRWEMDLSRTVNAPIPNVNGELGLHHILACDTLNKARQGSYAEALEDLEASWRIGSSVRERPEPLSQLMALQTATLQAGLLRRMRAAPPMWQQRLREHNYRKSFLVSFEADAWVISEYARQEGRPPFGGVVGGIPRVLFKPYFRLACSNYSDRMSRAAAELSQRDVCPFDSAGFEQRFGGPLPKWTLLSQLEMWSISQAWSRVRRLLMDLELTEKILRVRQLQTESKQKTWPREIPGIETSICSEAHWVYRVAPDEIRRDA